MCNSSPQLHLYDSSNNTRRNATEITNWLGELIQECTAQEEIKKSFTWWTNKLSGLKNRYYRVYARYRCCRIPDLKEILRDEARELKKNYMKKIHEVKEIAWRNFVSQHQAWGKPYKIIVKPKGGYGVPPGVRYPETNQTTETKAKQRSYYSMSNFPLRKEKWRQ